MRILRCILLVLVAVALAGPVAAGTSGSFRGQIVQKPAGAAGDWIYVRGRNGMIRRVDVSRAKVEYDESVPAEERTAKGREALVEGAEVRVTAEQGNDGEWRASRVEVLERRSEARDQPPAERQKL